MDVIDALWYGEISPYELGGSLDKKQRTLNRLIVQNEAELAPMRHTFAVSMLDAGEDLKSVQENLGHATAAYTLHQDAHVSQKMRMQSSKRMNDYFQKLLPQATNGEAT